MRDPGYSRRPYWDWLTPEGHAKLWHRIGCGIYLVGFFAWVYWRYGS
jgi:hypothetical protein